MILIVFPLLLGLIITGCYLCLKERYGKYNFLSFFSGVFFLCFVVAPLAMICARILSLPVRLPHWLTLMDDPAGMLYSQVFSILGYVAVVIGYHFSSGVAGFLFGSAKRSIRPAPDSRQDAPGTILLISLLLLVIGSATLLVYQQSIGGAANMIKYAGVFRSGHFPVVSKVAFLKNIFPVLLVAAYAAYALLWHRPERLSTRLRNRFLFLVAFLLAFYAIYHIAGRVTMIMFFLVFILYRQINSRETHYFRQAAFLLLALVFLYMGKEAFMYGIDPGAVQQKFQEAQNGGLQTAYSIIVEISFPFNNLGNMVMHVVPAEIDYRWFQDFYLAIAYLVPKRIFEMDLPPSISQINSNFNIASGTIPIDLLSFGYINGGVIGLFLTALAFGVVLKMMETALTRENNRLLLILKIAWALTLAQVVLYGDPVIAFASTFYLILSTLLIFFIYFLCDLGAARRTVFRGISPGDTVQPAPDASKRLPSTRLAVGCQSGLRRK